jgi:hypothetical protein
VFTLPSVCLFMAAECTCALVSIGVLVTALWTTGENSGRRTATVQWSALYLSAGVCCGIAFYMYTVLAPYYVFVSAERNCGDGAVITPVRALYTGVVLQWPLVVLNALFAIILQR